MKASELTHKRLGIIDPRVTLNDEEVTELKMKLDEIDHLEDMIQRYFESYEVFIIDKAMRNFKQDEMFNQISRQLTPLNHRVSDIVLNAEKRFIQEQFNDDDESILQDAKESIDKNILDDITALVSKTLNKELFKKGNEKQLFEKYIIRLMYRATRIHLNNCSEQCSLKIRKYLMQEAKKKFINDFGIDPNCDFRILRYNPNFTELRKPTPRLLDPNKRSDSSVSYVLNNYTIKFEEGIKQLEWHSLKFIDYLSLLFYESEIFDGRIYRIPFQHYMETFNLKAERNARFQIDKTISKLKKISIKIHDHNKKNNSKIDSTLIGGLSGYSNNLILIEASSVFIYWLSHGKAFTAPLQLLRINTLVYPNGYPILKKATEHKNMNFGATNEDIIRIRTLIEACRDLPRYADIEKTGQIDQRIKKPFFRDLNSLSETFTYMILNQENSIISEEEARRLPYDQFENLRLKLSWNAFPERKKPVKELS